MPAWMFAAGAVVSLNASILEPPPAAVGFSLACRGSRGTNRSDYHYPVAGGGLPNHARRAVKPKYVHGPQIKYCETPNGHLWQGRSRPHHVGKPVALHAKETIAWGILGQMRSFFDPVVHDSIMYDIILATHANPTLFFSVEHADHVKVRGEECPHPPTALRDFLAARPLWAGLTAEVADSVQRDDPLVADNPACQVRGARIGGNSTYGFSMLSARLQMSDWVMLMKMVDRHETKVHQRFTYVGRLRPDISMGAPHPFPSLERHTAYMVGNLPNGFLPAPDYLFVVPRRRADSGFNLLLEYRRCKGSSYDEGLELLPSQGQPPLLFGAGGPTGQLVRGLQRAEDMEVVFVQSPLIAVGKTAQLCKSAYKDWFATPQECAQVLDPSHSRARCSVSVE